MYQIIAASVPIDCLDLSEWTIDENEGSVISIQPLGQETADHKPMILTVSQNGRRCSLECSVLTTFCSFI